MWKCVCVLWKLTGSVPTLLVVVVVVQSADPSSALVPESKRMRGC